nr:hypothetical protein [Micromonospora sp. ATCC 39149]
MTISAIAAEDPQPDERRCGASFDQDERRHQRQPGGERAEGQPAPCAAVVEPDNAVGQQQHRGGGAGRSRQVVAVRCGLGAGLGRQQPERCEQDGTGHEHRGEEDPAPAEFGQQPADDEAQ